MISDFVFLMVHMCVCIFYAFLIFVLSLELACLFSKERRSCEVGRVGSWKRSGKRQGRGSHDLNIFCEKLFLLKNKYYAKFLKHNSD